MNMDQDELARSIKELETTVLSLRHRCEELEERVILMALAKIDDPRYPYSNWLLHRGLNDSARASLSTLLPALEARLKGAQVPPQQQRSIDGISNELLYGSGAPHAFEVIEAIKAVTGLRQISQVRDLLAALNDELLFCDLCDYVLDAIEERSGLAESKS